MEASKETGFLPEASSSLTPDADSKDGTFGGGPTKTPTFGKTLFLMCGIINFGMSYGIPTSLAIYFLEWQDTFQESRARTSMIHATCMGMINTLAILPGLAMQRFGARYTLLTGSVLASAGLAFTMTASSVTHMVVTVGVMVGLGCSMISLPTIPCITTIFHQRQSLVIASLTVGAAVANALLPFFYRYAAHEYSWKGACLIIGSVLLNTCISSLVITSFSSSTVPLRKTTSPKESSTSAKDLSAHQILLTSEESSIHNVYPEHHSSHIRHPSSEVEHHSSQAENLSSNNEFMKTSGLLAAISQQSLHGTAFGSQMFGSKCALSLCPLSTSNETHDVTKTEKKSCSKTLKFKYPFLLDCVFLVHVLALPFIIASIYALIALLMDFCKFKGIDKISSAFLIFIFFIASMVGKILSGILNLFPNVYSFVLLSVYGLIAGAMFIAVNHVHEYGLLCIMISVMGVVFGGSMAIYPKCVLDVHSVSIETYPVALGITNTAAGICDIVLPIIIGYSVDRFHSYVQVLYAYGFVAGGLSFALFVTFFCKYKRKTKGK